MIYRSGIALLLHGKGVLVHSNTPSLSNHTDQPCTIGPRNDSISAPNSWMMLMGTLFC